MVCDGAIVAEQSARGEAGGRSARFERYFLAVANRGALGRHPGALWPPYDVREPFNRWRKAGVWDRILQAVSKAYDGKLQMIDSSSIRVHQHAANGQKKRRDPVAWVARAAG